MQYDIADRSTGQDSTQRLQNYAGNKKNTMTETTAQAQNKLTKKQLKATAFRSKKKIKEILNDKVLPLPEDDDEELEPTQEPNSLSSSSTTKKRKRSDTSNDLSHSQDQKGTHQDEIITTTASKRRNRKKAAKLRENQSDEKTRSSKLILFVGNLPFDITSERLKSFFSEHCGEEPSVRLITTKTNQPNKKATTKGCGFIEFKSSSALQKALRLHHTPISSDPNPDEENQEKSRKINIELTAGGGGKSENRLKKLETSKLRLAKQREKILEKNLKSATIEKNSNQGHLIHKENSQFDVSIKSGSQKNSSKVSKTPLKYSLSGPNSIKLG